MHIRDTWPLQFVTYLWIIGYGGYCLAAAPYHVIIRIKFKINFQESKLLHDGDLL